MSVDYPKHPFYILHMRQDILLCHPFPTYSPSSSEKFITGTNFVLFIFHLFLLQALNYMQRKLSVYMVYLLGTNTYHTYC